MVVDCDTSAGERRGVARRLTLVGVLVKAAERIDLVVADVRHGRVDQTGGFGADGGDNLGAIAFILPAAPAQHRAGRRGRHDEGGVGWSRGNRNGRRR